MKKTLFSFLAAIGIFCADSAVQAGDTFTFAGFTFNQLNAPDTGTLLGGGQTLGGAVFSSGYATNPTAEINFPSATNVDFNSARALAPLVGLVPSSVKAINLPQGNNGTTTRHGIEVSWSNRGLPNKSGNDLVIYESGSNSNTVEGIMIRARVNTNNWTDWYYFAPTNFQSTGFLSEGLFAFSYDLSKMGLTTNDFIDRVQLANLMQADRIETAFPTDVGGGVLVGEGKVVFDNSSTNLPDAGPFDGNRRFDSTTYDPDPLYVVGLHDTFEVTPPRLAISHSSTNVVVTWQAPSLYTLEAANDVSTNITWGSISESVVLTNGKMTVSNLSTNSRRFFRLVKP